MENVWSKMAQIILSLGESYFPYNPLVISVLFYSLHLHSGFVSKTLLLSWSTAEWKTFPKKCLRIFFLLPSRSPFLPRFHSSLQSLTGKQCHFFSCIYLEGEEEVRGSNRWNTIKYVSSLILQRRTRCPVPPEWDLKNWGEMRESQFWFSHQLPNTLCKSQWRIL